VQLKKKERLYVTDLVDEPLLAYPNYYMLSYGMRKNEMLHDAIIALHTFDFKHYKRPISYEAIFEAFDRGGFAIYKERYVVGYFGGKMMYLEMHGWKTMPVTRELFTLDNWLV
jgi:hypothetical protein